MFHVDNNSAVPVMPAVKPVVSAVTSFFTEGGNGVPPTYPGPDWFNIIQSELLAILAAAGISPDKASNVQLLAAMRVLFLDASQNGADIQDKAAFLQNLGLKTAAQRDVGTAANQIPDMSAWASGPGWRRTPDGFIEQFGGISFPSSGGAATSTWVAFPISFPTGNIDTLVVYDGGFGHGNMWGATDWSGTGFNAHCNSDGEGARYFARGK